MCKTFEEYWLTVPSYRRSGFSKARAEQIWNDQQKIIEDRDETIEDLRKELDDLKFRMDGLEK